MGASRQFKAYAPGSPARAGVRGRKTPDATSSRSPSVQQLASGDDGANAGVDDALVVATRKVVDLIAPRVLFHRIQRGDHARTRHRPLNSLQGFHQQASTHTKLQPIAGGFPVFAAVFSPVRPVVSGDALLGAGRVGQRLPQPGSARTGARRKGRDAIKMRQDNMQRKRAVAHKLHSLCSGSTRDQASGGAGSASQLSNCCATTGLDNRSRCPVR